MKDLQVWMPVIAASMVVIGNAWALELFRKKTNSATTAIPAINRKKRDKPKSRWGTVSFILFCSSIGWASISLIYILTRHASEQATIRQVFIVAVNIFTVLFGVISIALAKLLDRIMTLLENMGDSFVETYNVINRISGVVEKIVAGLNRLDDSKPQKSKKKSPPPTAALGTTQDPQRPLN